MARVEPLPALTANAVLEANGSAGLVVLLPMQGVTAQRRKLPLRGEGEMPDEQVLLADIETADIMGSRLLPAVREAREKLLTGSNF